MAVCTSVNTFAQKGKLEANIYDLLRYKNFRYTIPFELRSNLIVIKVKVDTTASLNFILDTGVNATYILDNKTIPTKKIVRTITIKGLGVDNDITADVSVDHKLTINQVMLAGRNITFVRNLPVLFSEHMGVPIHGIIGTDLFKDLNVVIDYLHLEIIFTHPDEYKYKKWKGCKIPLHLEKGKPYVEIPQLSNNGKRYENVKLVIDSGGSHAALLDRFQTPSEFLPKRLVLANLGNGLNGRIEGEQGRIDEIAFCGVKLKSVLTSFPDYNSFGEKINKEEFFRAGSIGGEILKRFRVTINYKNQFMVLKPIKSALRKPFESNKSGLEVKTAEKKPKNTFEISRVVPNSTGDMAGLKEGDRILVLNGKVAKELSLFSITEELSQKENYPITMVIDRNSEILRINFRLKSLI